VTVTDSFLSSSSDNNSAQIWVWVADGAKNISGSGTPDNETDTIALDVTAPTATIVSMIGQQDNLTELDNQTYTDNHTVTMVLDYNDNKTVQYFISETNSPPSQYVDNVSGVLDTNTYRDSFKTGFTRDNVTYLDNGSLINSLTKTTWSILDNGSDNATESYVVTDNYSADNQTITLNLSSGDGLKTVYVWVKDAANNISLVANDNITVDAGGPDVSGTLTVKDTSSSSTSITDNLSIIIDNSTTLFTDNHTSVHRLYFNDNNTAPTSASSFNRIPNGDTDNLTYDFATGSGSYSAGDTPTLYVWAIDNLSNISATYRSDTITFDNASPIGGLDNVTVRGVVTFANRGNTIGDKTISDDNQTIYVKKTSSTITLDNASLLRASSDNTTLNFNASDNGTSGAVGAYNISTSVTKSVSEGSNTIYVWARDTALNGPTLIDNLTVVYDNTGPNIDNLTLFDNSSGSDNLTNASNATLQISFDNVTDAGIGVWKYYASTTGSYSDNTSLWTAFPSSSATVDNGTVTISNIAASEGQSVTVNVWVMDNLTNITAGSDTITVTSSNPSVDNLTAYTTDVTSTSASSISENVTILINAQDNFAVNSYAIFSSVPGASPGAWSSDTWKNFSDQDGSVSENATFSLSGQTLTDNMTLYVWLKDNASNFVDNYTVVYATLNDNASPIISSSIISDNSSGSTSTASGDNVTVSITAADTFGVMSYYTTDNASDNISAATFDNFSTQGTSVSQSVLHTFSSTPNNGTLTMYVYVKDAAGNVSDNASDNITYNQ
jgi:hypothetical protein